MTVAEFPVSGFRFQRAGGSKRSTPNAQRSIQKKLHAHTHAHTRARNRLCSDFRGPAFVRQLPDFGVAGSNTQLSDRERIRRLKGTQLLLDFKRIVDLGLGR